MFHYRESLFNVKAMKSEKFSPALFILYLLICICPQDIHAESIAIIEHPEITIEDDRGNELIQLQAVAELSNISTNGLRISELSDLAWNKDENLLHALSDNGYLLSFRPVFKDEQLHDLLLINGFALHDNKGKKLRWKKSDSEGLTLINSDNHVQGDTQYIVSFERHPRVIQYNREGFIEKQIEIPEKLGNRLNYRSENKSLESVVMHEQYGLMIGTEYSLKGEDKTQLGFYTLDGKFRSFPAHFPDGALTGLAITEDNSLLAIERIYGGLLAGFKIALHHLHIVNDRLEDKVIARFLPSEGYFNDNFEGIVKYKKDFYFMISDDNNHPLQRTILIYFKYPR